VAFETTLSGIVYLKKISLWQAQGYQVKLWFLSRVAQQAEVPRVELHWRFDNGR
jgi:predicted ABC-type ATPase